MSVDANAVADAGGQDDAGTPDDDDAGASPDAGPTEPEPDAGFFVDAPDVGSFPPSPACGVPATFPATFVDQHLVDNGEWRLPYVGGYHGEGVFIDADDNIWVVGGSGAVLRWQDGSWARATGLPPVDFTDVDGTSASDIWFSGDRGTLLHFDGEAFTAMAIGGCYKIGAVHASAPGEAWAVGFSTVWHGTVSGGFTNTMVEANSLSAIDGDRAGTVMMVARDGSVLRVAPVGAIESLALGLTEEDDLLAIRVFSATNVAIGGGVGSILRFDGTAITAFAPTTGAEVSSLAGTGFDNLYASYHEGCPHRVLAGGYAGCLPGSNVQPMVDATATRVVAVGRFGNVFMRENDAVSSSLLSQDGDHVRFPRDISGSGPDDIWVSGIEAAHWDGATWTFSDRSEMRVFVTPTGDAYFGDYEERFSGCGDDVFITREGLGMWHLRAGEFIEDPWASDPGGITSVACYDADDLYFVRRSGLFHWDGASVEAQDVPAPLEQVWVNAGRLYARTSENDLFRREGNPWARILSRYDAEGFFRDLAFSGESVVWLAIDGSDSAVRLLRFDGSTWMRRPVVGLAEIEGLYADGAGGLWIADVSAGVVRIDSETP